MILILQNSSTFPLFHRWPQMLIHYTVIVTVLWPQEAPCTYLVALKLSPLAAGRYHLCRAGGTRHSLGPLASMIVQNQTSFAPMRLVRSSAPIRKEVIHAYVILVAATMFSLSRSQKKRRGEIVASVAVVQLWLLFTNRRHPSCG